MDVTSILELATIIVAIITLGINLIHSRISAKKDNYVKISINHRSKNFEYARDLTTELLSLCSIDRIKINPDDTQFISVRDKLYYYYKSNHVEEAELQMAIEDLSDAYFALRAVSNEQTENTFLIKHNQFIVLSKIFEIAYWYFLQDHANAKRHHTNEFDYFYNKIRNDYNNLGYNIGNRGYIYNSRLPKIAILTNTETLNRMEE